MLATLYLTINKQITWISNFEVDVSEELFDETISSLGIEGQNTLAYLCPAGEERMAREFKEFPEQYKTNINFLKTRMTLLEVEWSFWKTSTIIKAPTPNKSQLG